MTRDPQCQKNSERDFYLPYWCNVDLLKRVKVNDLLSRWCRLQYRNHKVSPYELLVLEALRYLGCGWTVYDIEEARAVDKEVHRTFFNSFIEFGSTILYDIYVLTPIHPSEARSNMKEYEQAGLPRCIGSTDCTHITTERCEYNLKNSHLGQQSFTTCTYNLTCNFSLNDGRSRSVERPDNGRF